MITVEHLSKYFGELAVLKDVNATIEKGEVISIIGPSGTGKSTFLRCLNLLENPTGGNIIIDGVSLMEKVLILPESVKRWVWFSSHLTSIPTLQFLKTLL